MAGMPASSDATIESFVHQLSNPATRENALLELSKKRENFPELAPYLWYSFGTVAALLQEIVSIYPLLTPPSLTAHASNRVCNALALLQCVASHPETRGLFLQGRLYDIYVQWPAYERALYCLQRNSAVWFVDAFLQLRKSPTATLASWVGSCCTMTTASSC